MIHPQPTNALLLLHERRPRPPHEHQAVRSGGTRRQANSAALRRAARTLAPRRRAPAVLRPTERA